MFLTRILRTVFCGAVVTNEACYDWIEADWIRTCPLLYTRKKGNLYIGNDAYLVREKYKVKRIDIDTQLLFVMTSYVTGANTLISKIKHVQQGKWGCS